MDNIYDTLAKLNKVANAPEIVKEDSNALLKKGIQDFISKEKDKSGYDKAVVDASKMNQMYKPFSDKQSPDGLPEKKKDNKMFEKESDVERDDRAEKAGREVAHDAKYDGRDHAGKDGKDVTKDIEYDEKHDKDGMHESSGTLKDAARQGVMARLAELAGIPAQEIEEALGTPQDVAAKIMAENPLDEAEVEEGNEFSGERDKAIKAGKDSFEVDGKTYPVKGDKKNEAIEEAEHDGMPSMKEMQGCVDEGMTEDEICEKYSSCDEGKIKLMASKCGKMNEGGGRDMECGHCDGTGKHGDKDCKKCDGTGEAQDDDDPMNNESKVEETTSAGAVADGAGSGSSPYKNASVYESNEIVKRARQLNEDMSFTVTGGPDQEPTLNINASGQEAQQLAQLLKLSGLAMTAQQPSYGEVEIQVAEDQEFANGDQNEQTADTNTLVNAISGGLNGQKKMAYPKVAGGDNPMSGLLGESELVATSANQLLKQYEAFKAK